MKKLTKNELIALVRNVCEVNYDTEEEGNKMHELFEFNVPDPEALDLIYHHKPELTPEEIVEKALSYKPIITPPPTNTKK